MEGYNSQKRENLVTAVAWLKTPVDVKIPIMHSEVNSSAAWAR